jgi:hypothetical protein
MTLDYDRFNVTFYAMFQYKILLESTGITT